MKIEGANVIITGGARGFGQSFTEALLKHGAKVCFADINEEEGRQTEAEFHKTFDKTTCMFVRCDVSKEADFKALFVKATDAFGHVDILVNNAGILNELDIAKMIEVNLMGTIIGTNLAVSHMRKDKGGKGGIVVNVASIAGLFPAFFMPTYSATKHGIVGFTRSWAANPLNEDSYKLSFACLCPTFSETSMLSGVLDSEDPPLVTYKENRLAVLAFVNSMGINTVESVTKAFLELVQKENNNGSVLTVDGVNGPKYRYTKHPNRI